MILALYIYQVYIDHNLCLSKSGVDIGDSFDFAFTTGLVVIAADLVNSDVLSVYFKAKTRCEIDTRGCATWRSETILYITSVCEVGIWLAIVGVVIDHHRVITSKMAKSCAMEQGPLRQEAMWLQYLAGSLAVKLVVFIPWYLILMLTRKEKQECDESPTPTPTPEQNQLKWCEDSNDKSEEQESVTDSQDDYCFETLVTEPRSSAGLTSSHSERIEASMISKHSKPLSDNTIIFGDTTWSEIK